MLITNSQTVKDANEMMAMNAFRTASRLNVKNIIFQSSSKTITLNDVSEIDFVGGADAKDIKTDFRINYGGGNVFNVSLKRPNFKAWESADTLIGDYVAEKILGYLLEDLNNPSNARGYKPIPYNEGTKTRYRIIRTSGGSQVAIAYRCGRTDAKRVIFGSDILGRGAVISNNFNSAININGDTVEVNVNGIYQSLNDIPPEIFPYFQVNSVKESRNAYRFPGLRVEAKPQNALGNSIKISTPLRGLE
jgi:hypothetical protein